MPDALAAMPINFTQLKQASSSPTASRKVCREGGTAHCSKRLQIVRQQLHDRLSVAWMSPAIAVDAADQHLTVMVDFHERTIAVEAHLNTYSLQKKPGRLMPGLLPLFREGEMMMAGKPSPRPNYHLERINQPVQAEAPARGGTGASRFHWGAEPGFRRLAEPRDGQGKPSLPIYIYQPHEG
jgi:hypothetical protein